MKIPRYFCWTRFGTEAAQTIAQIIERKEEERAAGRGVFLWGIGNAVGRSILELLRISDRPPVLFSSIKSTPKIADVSPPSVAAWTAARGLYDEPFALPENALVTSRFDPESPKRSHYALVCYSKEPLALSRSGPSIHFRALRNLVTQRPLGASQVTAVVEHDEALLDDGLAYSVAIQAHLVAPYFIRLQRPVLLRQIESDGLQTFDFAAAREETVRFRNIDSEQLRLALTS